MSYGLCAAVAVALASAFLAFPSRAVFVAQYAYIASPDAPFRVSVVDTTDGRVVTGPVTVVDSAAGVVPSPDGERIFALSIDSRVFFGGGQGHVSVIEAATAHIISSVPFVPAPSGIAMSRDGRQLFTADAMIGLVAAFDTDTFKIRTSAPIQCGGPLVLSPDESHIYVACGRSIKRLRVSDLTVTGTTPSISELMGSLAASSDGATLYTTIRIPTILGPRYAIIAIAADTLDTRWQAPITRLAHTLALSADGSTVYATFLWEPGPSELAFFDAATGERRDALAIPEGPTTIAVSRDGLTAFVGTRFGPVVIIDLINRTRRGELAVAAGTLVLGGGRATVATPARAIEFHNDSLDHYFLTTNTSEIEDLDAGVHRGWTRTGQSFLAYAAGKSNGRGEPVCRFYGLPAAGLDSHFYSAHATECDDVARKFSASWQIEGSRVFDAPLPNLLTGLCPFATIAVYRLWNGRSDSNHRYTTDLAVRIEMLNRGFVWEGYGPMGVAMCATTLAVTAR